MLLSDLARSVGADGSRLHSVLLADGRGCVYQVGAAGVWNPTRGDALLSRTAPLHLISCMCASSVSICYAMKQKFFDAKIFAGSDPASGTLRLVHTPLTDICICRSSPHQCTSKHPSCRSWIQPSTEMPQGRFNM